MLREFKPCFLNENHIDKNKIRCHRIDFRSGPLFPITLLVAAANDFEVEDEGDYEELYRYITAVCKRKFRKQPNLMNITLSEFRSLIEIGLTKTCKQFKHVSDIKIRKTVYDYIVGRYCDFLDTKSGNIKLFPVPPSKPKIKYEELMDILMIVMDLYFIGRLFREYDKSTKEGPMAKNSIVVAGQYHIEIYMEILLLLGFEIKFTSGLEGFLENKINISKLKQPFFK